MVKHSNRTHIKDAYKFLRVKIFEDFCLALKILVHQRCLLKLISSLQFKLTVPLVLIFYVHIICNLQNCENFIMNISFKGKISQPRNFNPWKF